MPKTALHTELAPKPVAAYAQGVRAGQFLFLSGQIGIDPASGALVSGGVETETQRVLENLRAVLAAGGASFADVVKMTVYLADMNDFSVFNAVYVGYFEADPPARATVGVVALPRGARIEIDAVALLP